MTEEGVRMMIMIVNGAEIMTGYLCAQCYECVFNYHLEYVNQCTGVYLSIYVFMFVLSLECAFFVDTVTMIETKKGDIGIDHPPVQRKHLGTDLDHPLSPVLLQKGMQ